MSPRIPGTDEGPPDPPLLAAAQAGPGIVEHILQFVRLLRAAGLAVGPDRAVLATEAVLATGIASPSVLYWTLHAVLVTRREQHEVFDQAFFLFWKEPVYLQRMLELALSGGAGGQPLGARELARRLGEALLPQGRRPLQETDRADIDAGETFSAAEVLREKDFEAMSTDELRRARASIAAMTLVMQERETRRYARAARGQRIDLKAILHETAARGPDHLRLRFKAHKLRRPPLVVLCDVSGSMETYARMLLHFLYALTNARDRVHAFLFGTRLTDVTRALKGRDADLAIGKVARDVKDWSGGTRIGDSLAEFNRVWARRVLGQNALVLLITDGLDRDGGEGIAAAARRLKASCRRLVWMNPLLRYDGYSPLAVGARELAPHVSEMRPCHNLKSLEDLAAALGARSSAR